jgi:hypothetical protein
MERSICWTSAAALMFLGTGISAQVEEPRKDSSDIFRVLKVQPYDVLLARRGPACDADAMTCMIEMTLIKVEGRPYCLALAPDVRVKTKIDGASSKKAIVWELKPNHLDGKPVRFHDYAGIIITDDTESQIEKGGGLGDGSGGKPEAYHVKTSRNKDKAKSGYLPVILWGDKGEEELCAATDPKIVNAN